jgi:hypothetical protein
MPNAKYGPVLVGLGVGFVTIYGLQFGNNFGASWEPAALVFCLISGVVLIVAGSTYPLIVRIADLEKKLASLEDKVADIYQRSI